MIICINKSLWEELNILYRVATRSDRNPIAHSDVLLYVNCLFNEQALILWFTGKTQHNAVVTTTDTEVSDPCPFESFCRPVSKAVFIHIYFLNLYIQNFHGLVPFQWRNTLCRRSRFVYRAQHWEAEGQPLIRVLVLRKHSQRKMSTPPPPPRKKRRNKFSKSHFSRHDAVQDTLIFFLFPGTQLNK